MRAARASVAANEVALAGVREEAKVGQRTTLDVLNAQQALLKLASSSCRPNMTRWSIPIRSSRPSAASTCRRSGSRVAEYDPRVHYNQVKSKWIGLRTPDGK